MAGRSKEYHAALGSPSRRQVLDVLLASPGPLDSAAVAGQLGLHVTTARSHLDQLVAAGLARRTTGTERRRGRPRVLYAPAGRVRDDDTREQLLDVLAAVVARGDDPTASSVRAGRRWARSFERPDPANPVPGLIDVLDQLGFEPETGQEDDTVLLRTCPFRDTAREHPQVVCSVHRGLVEELLSRTTTTARLVPFAEPELCLVALGSGSDTG